MARNGNMRARGRPDARAAHELAARLARGSVLVLDGATGTELERRGVRTTLPLWSALALLEAPGAVEAIHRDYVEAGAEALTANTFRTHARSLAHAGLAERAGELCAAAVALARAAAASAAADRRVFVLGSAAPLEDCYRPDLVPGPRELEAEHALHAGHLARAGVDAILVETMNTVREAKAALAAALGAGRPALVSFVCGAGARLLSGETLASAVEAVAPLAPLAVLVNCLPPRAVDACLPVLAASGLPFGAYANLGRPGDEGGFTRSDDCLPEEFAAFGARWIERGARAVGGCCGTTPAHLRALAAAAHGQRAS
jgi:S-methylmethionine-dependent homocysteine/selenocysteine methylase